MSPLRTSTASLSLAALTAATLVVVAPPAAALASPLMSVTVRVITGGFRACAYGSAATGLTRPPHWEFTLAGSTIPVVNSIADDSTTFYSASVPACMTVAKLNSTAGAFTASLTLVSDGLDLSYSVVGTGSWDPVEGDRTTSMRTCGEAGCFVTESTP